jgi:hypothetical protein
MSTDDLRPAGRPVTHTELLLAFLERITSDWGRTFRLALLIIILAVPVAATFTIFVLLGTQPWQWSVSLLCSAAIGLLIVAFRRLSGKFGPNRR